MGKELRKRDNGASLCSPLHCFSGQFFRGNILLKDQLDYAYKILKKKLALSSPQGEKKRLFLPIRASF